MTSMGIKMCSQLYEATFLDHGWFDKPLHHFDKHGSLAAGPYWRRVLQFQRLVGSLKLDS